MPDFTITRQINADVEIVWRVLEDFGDIHRWSPGVKASELTSGGPVGVGSTRHCDFLPFGGVEERIVDFTPQKKLTVDLYQTSMLPISWAEADFNLESNELGTLLTMHYKYKPNIMGRLLSNYTDKEMRKGIGGLTKALALECDRILASE